MFELIAHFREHKPFRQIDFDAFFHVDLTALDDEAPWIPEVEGFDLERVVPRAVEIETVTRSDHTDGIRVQRPFEQHRLKGLFNFYLLAGALERAERVNRNDALACDFARNTLGNEVFECLAVKLPGQARLDRTTLHQWSHRRVAF